MAALSWAPAVLFPRLLTTSRSSRDWRRPLLCRPGGGVGLEVPRERKSLQRLFLGGSQLLEASVDS